MKLIYDPTLISKLKDCHLLLDTNVFFHAVDNKSFYDFLLDVHEAGCAFMTVPSVVFEFARGAKSISEFNWYVDFINNLDVSVYKDAETEIMQDKAFAVLLQKYVRTGKKGTSYTDFLLLMMLHKFKRRPEHIFLMTSNYSDVPSEIFDRETILSLEYEDGVQTQALYKNSSEKLKKLENAI